MKIFLLFAACTLAGQALEQRGFIENRALLFPQTTTNDSARVTDQAQIRWDASGRVAAWLKLNGGIEVRADTHRQVAREFSINFDDRTLTKPSLSMRTLSANLHKGKVTAELGRQIIRWGKTDILTPTDRFAPRDYLASVVDSDFLGVSAARVTIADRGNSLDLVWQPWFTPSRTPLFNQRWTALPPQASGVAIVDQGSNYPGRSQFGARWNQVLPRGEYSVSFFDGFNHLPSFNSAVDPISRTARTQRFFPRMRMLGGDAAVPFSWFTLKGEAAHFSSSTPGVQNYSLYVIQVERQIKEWSLVGGWAGEIVAGNTINAPRFAPDRGFAKSLVARAGLAIDANRSLAIETAVRSGGSFLRFEYAQAYGQHWRVTPGIAWIRGNTDDFLGQYRRNSYFSLALRYSF